MSAPAWAWVAVLAVAAALVPLAAWRGEEAARGLAAAPAAARAAVQAAVAPPRPVPFRVAWRDSVARGAPSAGWLAAGVRLPAVGPGYYTYDPSSRAKPNAPDRRWGTAALIRELVDLGRWWERTHPGAARIGVGDLSRPGGGSFAVGHVSHQNGRDADLRLPRRDGVEGRSGPENYDRALTQALVDRLVAQGAELVLVGPGLDLRGKAGVVMRWPNHDDHIHVRFPDPDGTGN